MAGGGSLMGGGTASLVGQAAGAVAGAAGSIFSAQSDKMGLRLNAYFNDLNARVENDNAREVLRQGQFEEARSRLDTAQVKSSQRAAMAANGVDLSTGSALTRQVSTDYIGETDAATIRMNAARAAAGHRTSATNYQIQGDMQRSAAKGISPLLAGATSLVGSAGKISSDWYRLKETGAIGGAKKTTLGGQSYINGSFGFIG
jgi:hypothetical protein